MHIKIIKGKKYYYESKRIGKRVISKYIGPVKPIRKRRKLPEKPTAQEEAEELQEQEESKEDDFYIG